jgi:hypothetical protein
MVASTILAMGRPAVVGVMAAAFSINTTAALAVSKKKGYREIRDNLFSLQKPLSL